MSFMEATTDHKMYCWNTCGCAAGTAAGMFSPRRKCELVDYCVPVQGSLLSAACGSGQGVMVNASDGRLAQEKSLLLNNPTMPFSAGARNKGRSEAHDPRPRSPS